jgi:hypothetical protein
VEFVKEKGRDLEVEQEVMEKQWGMEEWSR